MLKAKKGLVTSYLDIAIIATMVLIVVFLVYQNQVDLIKLYNEEDTKTEQQLKSPEKTSSNEEWSIEIAKLDILAPVILNVDAKNEDEYYKKLEDGVAHMKNTALPGGGNTVIFGHSSYYIWKPGEYKNVFEKLNNLENEDQIILKNRNQEIKYKVIKKEVVSPTRIEVADPTEKSQLTLITCWPVGSTKNRLVVVAEQIE